jgi:hypothetical protein
MNFAKVSADVLGAITKLAPLSVIIAALALLHNFRQAAVKRDRDEASAIREILSKLGVKAYVLNWSLVGSSPIAAAVQQIREAIETRIGKKPSGEDLASFISDQLLFEGVVEKAWRDSKVIERFQSEALEFGKLRSDLGDRVPVMQAALQEIDTRLRMLFLLNTFVVFSMRNDDRYKTLGRAGESRQSGAGDAMAELQRLLFSASSVPDRGAFSEACKFIEEFSRAATSATDDAILDLTRHRRSYLRRFRDWQAVKKSRHRDDNERYGLLQKLKDKAPDEFPLMTLVVDNVMQKRHDARVGARLLEQSSMRTLQVLKGNPRAGDLNSSIENFLTKHGRHESAELKSLSALLRIRSLGVDDPDVDVLLASPTGVTELLKSAVSRGGRVGVTLQEVLARHQQRLEGIAIESGPPS